MDFAIFIGYVVYLPVGGGRGGRGSSAALSRNPHPSPFSAATENVLAFHAVDVDHFVAFLHGIS